MDRAVAADRLLALALARPAEAEAQAQGVLSGRPGPGEASVALQALAIVRRDRGEVVAALRLLERARRAARAGGDLAREADVQATLGVTLALAGRTREGMAALDAAAASSTGRLTGQVLMRRAAILRRLGRFAEALDDLTAALGPLRRAGDDVWVARTLTQRAEVHLALGQATRAAADFTRAEEMFARTGQDLEQAKARHNRGLVAFAAGDLPGALRDLADADIRYRALGVVNPDLPIDRCAVLLAAGLASDAYREALQAVDWLPAQGGHLHRRAELLDAAATAALAAGMLDDAQRLARRARDLFGRQARPLRRARAELVLAEARFTAGQHPPSLVRRMREVAGQLARARADDAARAQLLTGRLLLARGNLDEAGAYLDEAARSRLSGPPLARCTGWLARALQAQARVDGRAVLIACTRGLAAIAEHQATLGDSELRARATTHGRDLAAIALREAVRRRDARLLLTISERWRATALATRPVPPDDSELAAELTALRAVSRLTAVARDGRAATTVLEREQRRLEESVRSRSHHRGGAPTMPGSFRSRELLAALGDTTLVELVDVDGRFLAALARAGRVRLHDVGPTPGRELEPARAALRRLAHGVTGGPGSSTLLAGLGAHLERVLLGPAVADLGPGPVVIVPPARLQAVPWGLMPALAQRDLSVVPSAATWLRTRASPPAAGGRVVLVAGPDLGTGGAEVPLLHRRYPDAVLLTGADVTVDRVLAALDGAGLAHVAAHGTFRADNPRFSALHLSDGPLTGHDLERLRRAPDRLILSSCDSGVGAPVGADEILGLVASLVSLGARGILAATGPVNDAAVVPLMLAVHDGLGRGRSLPAALAAARRAVGTDALGSATAASFLAVGR